MEIFLQENGMPEGCNPPAGCFECPYPDCILPSNKIYTGEINTERPRKKKWELQQDLELLLKGNMPEKYRERIEQTNIGGGGISLCWEGDEINATAEDSDTLQTGGAMED